MCTGLELLAAGAATAGTVATIQQGQEQRKEAKNARNMATQAETDRKAAADKATQNAYAQQQFSKRALRENSLFTGGGEAGGRTTLGV